MDAKGGYTVNTRKELLGKTINARLAVSQVAIVMELNPVLSVLRKGNGEYYVSILRRIEGDLVELEGDLNWVIDL